MRLRLVAVLLAAPALALSACTTGDEAAAPTTASSASAPAATDGSAPTTSGSNDTETPAESPSGSTRAAQVLIEGDFTMPTKPDDKAHITVTELSVDDTTMTVRAQVTPDFASVSDSEAISMYDITRGQRIFLLDRENLKRYDLVSGGPGRSLQSEVVFTETVNGSPMSWWGVYAAPEDDVSNLELYVLDAWAPLVVPVA